MSKESFWAASENQMRATEIVIERIERHGGTIIWPSEPKEPPPPAVCTCPQHWKDDGVADFDKPGYWHLEKCSLYVPF